MATGEKVYIADKKTVDKIHTLLLSSEIGLAVLKELMLESAGDSETIVDSIGILGENIGTVKECITDNTNGLGAIKEALEGRANEITSTAIKGLLENTEYGLDALKNSITGRANETTIVAVKELLENGTNGLNAIKTAISGRANESTSTAIKGLLENGTYGLNALKNAVNGRANEITSTAIKSLLENGTYGLNALKTAITGNVKAIKSVQRGIVTTSDVHIQTISVSSVNVSKSFAMASNGILYANDTNVSGSAAPYIELTSSTTIKIGSGTSAGGKIAWQLVEFY